jgi:hypothetical protein
MSLEGKRIRLVCERISVGSLCLALLLLLMFGCGSGSATTATGVREPEKNAGGRAHPGETGSVHKVPWAGRPGRNRQFILFAFVGYCSHGPKPYPQKVSIKRKARRVVLTLFVHFPPRAHPCLGEEIQLRTTARFQTPPKHLVFVDGSQSPVVQRWPRP